MNAKLLDVVRSVLTAAGAVVVYMGVMEEATWVTLSGALMTMIPVVWAFLGKDNEV
jgi:hypothetical protein